MSDLRNLLVGSFFSGKLIDHLTLNEGRIHVEDHESFSTPVKAFSLKGDIYFLLLSDIQKFFANESFIHGFLRRNEKFNTTKLFFAESLDDIDIHLPTCKSSCDFAK